MTKYYKFSDFAPIQTEAQLEAQYSYYRDKILDSYSAYNGCMSLGTDLMHNGGWKKVGGYAFNMTPFLKCYLVAQYGSISTVWAKNKTAIRKILYGKMKIGLCPKELK